MKDFSDATFVPEMVVAMTEALDASVATLPHPVSSTQVNRLAESILRTAQAGECRELRTSGRHGERDPAILHGWRFWNCRSRRAAEETLRLLHQWGERPWNLLRARRVLFPGTLKN